MSEVAATAAEDQVDEEATISSASAWAEGVAQTAATEMTADEAAVEEVEAESEVTL